MTLILVLFQNCGDVKLLPLNPITDQGGPGATPPPVPTTPDIQNVELTKIGFFNEVVGFTADNKKIYKYGVENAAWTLQKTYEIFVSNPLNGKQFIFLGSTKKHAFYCKKTEGHNPGDYNQSVMIFTLNESDVWELESELEAYCYNDSSSYEVGVAFNENFFSYVLYNAEIGYPRKYVVHTENGWSLPIDFSETEGFDRLHMKFVNGRYAIREIRTPGDELVINTYEYNGNAFVLSDSRDCSEFFNHCSANDGTWKREFFVQNDKVVIAEKKYNQPAGTSVGYFQLNALGELELLHSIYRSESESTNFPNFHVNPYVTRHISITEDSVLYIRKSDPSIMDSLNELWSFNLLTGAAHKKMDLPILSANSAGANVQQTVSYTNGIVSIVRALDTPYTTNSIIFNNSIE